MTAEPIPDPHPLDLDSLPTRLLIHGVAVPSSEDILTLTERLALQIDSLKERVAQLEAHVDAIHKVVVLIPVPQNP